MEHTLLKASCIFLKLKNKNKSFEKNDKNFLPTQYMKRKILNRIEKSAEAKKNLVVGDPFFAFPPTINIHYI